MENSVSSRHVLSLSPTLSCGQCFRWYRDEEGYWRGVVGNREYRLDQNMVAEPSSLFHTDPGLRRYFALDMCYDVIISDIASRDARLVWALDHCPGIRVLRQDPFETLLSFIISQNNNIPRISGIIGRLCGKWGRPVTESNRSRGFRGMEQEEKSTTSGEVYAFPTPEALAEVSEQEFRNIGAGFRAPYLVDAVTRVLDGRLELQSVAVLPLDEARSVLQEIHGVGPKVAECVLLYGFGRLEAFPVDVWMKRAMEELFPGQSPSWFGPYAGVAQQYIFHAVRTEMRGGNNHVTHA